MKSQKTTVTLSQRGVTSLIRAEIQQKHLVKQSYHHTACWDNKTGYFAFNFLFLMIFTYYFFWEVRKTCWNVLLETRRQKFSHQIQWLDYWTFVIYLVNPLCVYNGILYSTLYYWLYSQIYIQQISAYLKWVPVWLYRSRVLSCYTNYYDQLLIYSSVWMQV